MHFDAQTVARANDLLCCKATKPNNRLERFLEPVLRWVWSDLSSVPHPQLYFLPPVMYCLLFDSKTKPRFQVKSY